MMNDGSSPFDNDIAGTSAGINEINITPFVDIVLVLLIIFMISTPALVYKGMRIQLPQTTVGEDLSHVTLRLALTKEGQLLLDDRAISDNQLIDAVGKLQKSKVVSDAVISADKDLAHGKVLEVIDRLKTLGITQVGLESQPKKPATK